MEGKGIRAARLADIVRSVAEAVRDPADVQLAADDALRAASEALGANGAAVFVLSECDGLLVPAAAFGPQAPFLKDIAPLERTEEASEIAQVVASGEPLYVADTYPQAMPEDDLNGIGRWRNAIPTGSHAVLPLDAEGKTIGALTLQWPDAREFTPEEATLLSAIAAAIAAVVHRAGQGRTGRRPIPGVPTVSTAGLGDRSAPSHTSGRALQLGTETRHELLVATPKGTLFRAEERPGGPWAATFATAIASGASQPREHARHPFWRAFRLPAQRVGLVFGWARCAEKHAADFAEVCSAAARTQLALGSDAALALWRAFASASATYGDESDLCLLVGSLSLTDDVFEYSNVRATPPVLLCRDGRVKPLAPASVKLHRGAEPHADLVMPGDTLVLVDEATIERTKAGVHFGLDRLPPTLRSLHPVAGSRIPEAVRKAIDEWSDEPAADETLVLAVTRHAF